MMNEEIYIQIEAYLGGSMNSEEAQAFEAKIASDPELAREVNLQDSINHHLREENWKSIPKSDKSEAQNALAHYFESREAQDLEKKLRKVKEVYTKETMPASKKISFLPYAAAIAVILITSIAYLLLQPKSYDTLYAEYYTPKDLPSLARRGTVTNQALTNGISAFTQKNYPKAIASLTRYAQTTDTLNPLVYSYIGISHLELGETDSAIIAFDNLLHSDHIDKSKALWYTSLVYLKTKQKEKLKEILITIMSDPSNYNYSKAKKLLDEL